MVGCAWRQWALTALCTSCATNSVPNDSLSGKSHTLQDLGKGEKEVIKPTSGFSIKQAQSPRIAFSCWEVGGAPTIRKYWHKYINDTIRALVYVVDASDSARFDEAREELHMFMDNHAPRRYRDGDPQATCPWPLVVVANFCGKEGASSKADVEEALNLESLTVVPSAIHVAEGVYQADAAAGKHGLHYITVLYALVDCQFICLIARTLLRILCDLARKLVQTPTFGR